MTIIIKGNPATKKNSQMIVKTKTGRNVILQSKNYRKFEKDAMRHLPKRRCKKAISYPVNVKYTFYMKTRRRVDLSNLIEALDDILVKAGWLYDDNCNIIVSHDGCRVKHDKNNPRTVAHITPTEERSYE